MKYFPMLLVRFGEVQAPLQGVTVELLTSKMSRAKRHRGETPLDKKIPQRNYSERKRGIFL